MKKEKLGRPTIEKDPKRKQMNVMISGSTQENETFKERVKYMSFSAYVNSLIDADINKQNIYSPPTFTEKQVQELKSEVHAITGNGKVMQCFNALLGVAAGS